MSLANKVAQFDADSDTINAWVHGSASTSVLMGTELVSTPAKLIFDQNARINLDAEGVLELATLQASTATTQAGIATDQVALATAEKDAAVIAKTAAELAATNALISVGNYTTEALGRAAVADGEAFKVQGSGDVAAYEYRRIDSATSVLIATYPSAEVAMRADAKANASEQAIQPAPTIYLPVIGECASVIVNDANVVMEAITLTGDRYIAQNNTLVKLELLEIVSNKNRVQSIENAIQLAPTIYLQTIGECASVTVNDAGIVIEAITSTGIRFVEQNGVLVQLELVDGIKTAPTINIPDIGYAAVVYTDEVSGAVMCGITQKTAPTVDIPGIGSAAVVYTDEASGAVLCGITQDGAYFHTENDNLSKIYSSTVTPDYTYIGTTEFTYVTADANIVDMWVVVGQSLGVGTNNDLDDATVSGTPQPQHAGYAYTFSNGAYVGRPSHNYPIDALGELREVGFIQNTSGFWESISSRFGWTLLDKMQLSLGVKQKIFVCSSASNGRTFAQLTRGDPKYGLFLDHLKAAKSLLSAEGYTPRLRGLLVLHGEQDTSNGVSRTAYKKMLHTWRQWAEEDARMIFGDAQLSASVQMYTYQTNRGGSGYFATPNISAAQLDANDQNPFTTCVGPIYWATKATGDGAHPNAISYARIGEQFADAVFKHTYSGLSFQPLHVVESYWLNDTTIRLIYTEDVAVETTDDLVAISTLGTGKGFDFFDGTATPPTVTSVSVVSANIIALALSVASTGKSPRIYYACRTTGSGAYKETGHRGGVRAATSYMTSAITSTPNYHWACQQVITIGEMK